MVTRQNIGSLMLPPMYAQSPPDWQEILAHFRGSELQNYFTRILEDDLQATIKPQYVDHIPKAVRCVSSKPTPLAVVLLNRN